MRSESLAQLFVKQLGQAPLGYHILVMIRRDLLPQSEHRIGKIAVPPVRDRVALLLYMNQLVREDGWGNPIVYEVISNTAFRLVSRGADGRIGTSDDIVVENNRPTAP